VTDIIQELRGLIAKATPGPWEIDTEQSEGEYGSAPDTGTGYDDFLIGADIAGKWATLLTTENSTVKEIEEDYDEDHHRAWDAVGEANAKLVIAAINQLPALLDRLEAAERGWQPIETAPRAGETVLLFNADEQLVDCGFFCTWVGDDRPGHWEVTGNNHWYQGDVTHWRPLPDAPAIREVKL
jgi:hypothetical protein